MIPSTIYVLIQKTIDQTIKKSLWLFSFWFRNQYQRKKLHPFQMKRSKPINRSRLLLIMLSLIFLPLKMYFKAKEIRSLCVYKIALLSQFHFRI